MNATAGIPVLEVEDRITYGYGGLMFAMVGISSVLASLALLLVMGLFGIAVLSRMARFLAFTEKLVYGFPLGCVLVSLAILAVACVADLRTAVMIGGVLACVVGLVLVLQGRGLFSVGKVGARHGLALPAAASFRFALFPTVVIGGFVLRWALLWSSGLIYDERGLWAGHINIWADWPVHLGNTMSFVYGENFPPQDPRLPGYSFAYHYLTSITNAAMVELGMQPTTALVLHSFIFSALITVGLYLFVHRLTKDRSIAALTLVLFFLGQGLGWVLTAKEMIDSSSVLGTLLNHPWDFPSQQAGNFRFQNVYFSFIESQRGFLYGLPLGLLILTFLFEAVQTRKVRWFATAGIVAGLLPIAHLSTMLALALITPFLFLLFPSLRWTSFFALWVTLAVPQLYFQQANAPVAVSSLRLLVGWVAPPDNWLWFWVKNQGFFLPLLAIALFKRNLMPAPAKRFLWAFMPIFAIVNLFALQPWDWDNHKMLIYWFLAVSALVAALLVTTWRQLQMARPLGAHIRVSSFAAQAALVLVVLSMILSGLLVNLQQLLGKDRHLLLTTEELQLAEIVRAKTPPDAIFAVGLQHNHPVPMLSGRRVLMSYTGWLFASGVDYSQRERDLRAMYMLAPDAQRLLAAYDVDYVVIGPRERQELGANLSAYRQRYPSIIKTANYEVFDVQRTNASGYDGVLDDVQ